MTWRPKRSRLALVDPMATSKMMSAVAEAPAREPFDCPTATFDDSLRDPRRLVVLYQQRMRAALLAKVAEEEARPSTFRRALDACQDALGTCEDGLRWIWLAEPCNTTRKRSASTPRPIAARRLWIVPTHGADAEPARTSA
jgi:hypothetical protein